jgi:hypothetical protein
VDACQIVKDCPATDKRLIRFVKGPNGADGQPRAGALSEIICQEAPVNAKPVNPCPQ